jgi:hypothetical protein
MLLIGICHSQMLPTTPQKSNRPSSSFVALRLVECTKFRLHQPLAAFNESTERNYGNQSDDVYYFVEMTMFKTIFIQQIPHQNYTSQTQFRVVINPIKTAIGRLKYSCDQSQYGCRNSREISRVGKHN